MVFYAQSTSTVISGRVETGVRIYTEREGGADRQRHRERDRDRDRDIEGQRHRERERQTDRQTDRAISVRIYNT